MCIQYFVLLGRGPENNKYVFFYFGPFAYLGGETTPQSSQEEVQNFLLLV